MYHFPLYRTAAIRLFGAVSLLLGITGRTEANLFHHRHVGRSQSVSVGTSSMSTISLVPATSSFATVSLVPATSSFATVSLVPATSSFAAVSMVPSASNTFVSFVPSNVANPAGASVAAALAQLASGNVAQPSVAEASALTAAYPTLSANLNSVGGGAFLGILKNVIKGFLTTNQGFDVKSILLNVIRGVIGGVVDQPNSPQRNELDNLFNQILRELNPNAGGVPGTGPNGVTVDSLGNGTITITIKLGSLTGTKPAPPKPGRSDLQLDGNGIPTPASAMANPKAAAAFYAGMAAAGGGEGAIPAGSGQTPPIPAAIHADVAPPAPLVPEAEK